jgi:hypothetical protein
LKLTLRVGKQEGWGKEGGGRREEGGGRREEAVESSVWYPIIQIQPTKKSTSEKRNMLRNFAHLESIAAGSRNQRW